ncbi:MAG: cation transporter [Alphaproteobacteria bacterium]|nr:cation transporter [Alphaproteobacteria bacterium]
MGMGGQCCDGIGNVEEMPYRRIMWAVLAVNAVMFLIEAGAGLGAKSVALQADALDFLADAATYGITLLVLPMAIRWRARAALVKGASMALFGLWVLGATAYNAFLLDAPDALVMGSVGVLALLANLFCALLLFRFRGGDSNKRSAWLCSRNDVLGNLAVIVAAGGVSATGTAWPDLAVALIMAALWVHAAVQIIRQAIAELRPAPAAAGSRA